MHSKAKKYIAFLLLFFVIGGFAVGAIPTPAKAQWATLDIPTIGGNIWEAIKASYDKITKQVLATAFKKSLSTFLNKLAYDSAVYVAAGGSGQKGLVNPFSKKALSNLADATAGEFIDQLATKSGFTAALGTTSLCEPVDLTMKANLLMSFKKPKEPPTPKCSLTKMKQAAQKTAKDNLLEFNAGFEESEGGLNITLRGLNGDQIFQTTTAQTTLTGISEDLTKFLAELHDIMGGIAEALATGDPATKKLTDMTAQSFAESQLPRIKELQDEFVGIKNSLEVISNNASECAFEYKKNGSVCGNGIVTTGEECDVDALFCSVCRIAGGAGSDCGGPNEQCTGSKAAGTLNTKTKTCQDLGYAPGSGGTGLDCNSVTCHFVVSGGACSPLSAGVCTDASLMPHCADFTNTKLGDPSISATSCYNNSGLAAQYSDTILSAVSSYLTQVDDLVKKTEDKAFADVVNNDPSDIANAFNPEANEMGQFGKIQETLSQKTQDQLEHEKLKTLAEGPCKGVTKPITGEVVTPSAATCAAINEALAKSTKGQETFTGTIADAFGVFVNTLTSKLMERYFKKGLSVVFDAKGLKECTRPDGTSCKGSGSGDKTEDVLRSGASMGGKASAEKAFGGFLTASIETGGQQDILSILASCPPEQPSLNNCIIDEPFRRAIEKQYTVREAMDAYKKSGGSEGLDPKKPFGYIIVGTAMDEPDFKNGYPYRSMLYLRKYRIIPVGWELAAQYIKDIEATKQVHTLENVVSGFNDPTSPFFGLADPAWVLKSPQVFCARQGPGPELISTEIQCEKFNTSGSTAQCMSDDYQSRKVSRKEWCADEQTCLEEGENGDCKRYGYCTLEKPSWKLGGTQCDKPFASCEGYTNTVTKASYTVLENTLNKKDCNQSNVGCQWYCQDAPKMCKGGTRSGQPCGINNDCASIYCSVGKCVSSGIACSYDNDCGSGATGFCSNNNAISCTNATVVANCGAGNQCILCNTGAHACVNGDTPGAACTNNAQCGRGVVDGVCEEGGVWSCKEENLVNNPGFEDGTDASVTAVTQATPYTFNNWGVWRNSTTSLIVTKDSTRIKSGLFSAKVVAGGDSDGLYSKFSPNNSKGYAFSADIYVESGAARLCVGNNVIGKWKCTYSTTINQWERVSASVNEIENNTINANEVLIYSSNAATFYVDNARLFEGDRINLDRDVKKCEAKDAGCDQFIKVSPGTNLIGNSGFEEDADAQFSPSLGMSSGGYINRWYIRNNSITSSLDAKIDTTIVHSGKNSLYVKKAESNALSSSANGLYMGDSTVDIPTPSVVPLGFKLDPAKTYTASAWIYVVSPTTSKVALSFGHAVLGIWKKIVTNQPSSRWERISIAITPDIMLPGNDRNNDGIPDRAPNEIRIHLDSGNSGFYIDDLQLEEGDTASNYTQYGSSNQAYLNGRRLSCLKQEVGCNLYTPADGGEPIPAVVKTKDQCPAECAGYASFHQLPSFFEPSNDPVNDYPNLIPSTAVSCQASSVGCEEFTNLDTVASGGEAKEYYTKLRQCAKPGTTTEATYYTWEGSEEAGFQLRAWRLKADGARPYTTDGFVGCADLTNPDCRTFYDQSGAIFLEELSSTVFISNECHPLRKTIQGTRQDCNDSGGRAEPAGAVMADIVTCFYDAIPSQGIKCAPKYAGCREYRGAAGNNLRVALNDDFEDLTSQGWTPSSLSSESLTVGGRSYYLFTNTVPDPNNYTLGKNVAGAVTEGKTYVLEFWAKWNKNEPDPSGSGQPISSWRINARFQATGLSNIAFPSGTDVGNSGEWNKYTIGPVVFDRAVSPSETLMIFPADGSGVLCEPEPSAPSSPCAGNFYLDNIVLREITDNPYLIRDSWKTPLSCDLDPSDPNRVFDTIDNADGITSQEVGSIRLNDSAGFPNPGGLYNILIAIDGEIMQYTNVNVNILENITRGMRGTTPAAHRNNAEVWLLDEGAQLGCKEYTDRLGRKKYLRSFDYLCSEDKVGCTEMFNTNNSRSMYEQSTKGEYVSRDAAEYVVDNPKLYCDASFKGCEKMGQPALGQSGEVATWGETYLINDPDQYDKIACESNENMCSEFTTRTGGTAYFKDPKDALCEYHSSINIEGVITKGWFKKGVVPASLGGLIFYDSDGDGAKDAYAHLECATTAGAWSETKWTYSCPNDQVGCTEYQNPVVGALPNSNNASYALEQGVDSASCTGVIDREIGCVPFYDSSNPILNIDSSVIGGNAFAPAACFKCSLVKDSKNTSVACNPANGDICSCDNTANGRLLDEYCNSNTILKVKADRQCAEWLACTESQETTDSKGNIIRMCKKRQACVKAGDGVECAPGGLIAESKQNQTFDDPVLTDAHKGAIADANLRSGLFKAGAHWAKVCDNSSPPKICQIDADCGAGVACVDWPTGKCTGNENTACVKDSDCQPPVRPTSEGVCGPFFEGYYPYGQMTQGWCSNPPNSSCVADSDCGVGNQCLPKAIAFEDDFETYQAGVLLPQCSTDAAQPGTCIGDNPLTPAVDEDTCKPAKTGICLNYWSSTAVGGAKATNKEFKFGGQSLLVSEPTNIGAANAIKSKPISVTIGETYALTAWINTKDLKGKNRVFALNRVVIEVVDSLNNPIGAGVYMRQEEIQPWTKYIVPFKTTDASIQIIVYLENMDAMNNPIAAGSKAYIDMISLAPVLTIQANPIDPLSLPSNYNLSSPANISNPLPAAFTDRSCRIYAKPDALSCKYRERNTGREIQGWRGFCAEADPKNPEYCLQWWPIDLISGEDISKF